MRFLAVAMVGLACSGPGSFDAGKCDERTLRTHAGHLYELGQKYSACTTVADCELFEVRDSCVTLCAQPITASREEELTTAAESLASRECPEGCHEIDDCLPGTLACESGTCVLKR